MTALLENNRLNGHAIDAVQPGSALTPETRFPIGRDKLNEALALLKSEKDRHTLDRFWTICAQRDMSNAEVGRLLIKRLAQPRREKRGKIIPGRPPEYYSHDSVYQLLTGKRMRDGANIAPVLRAMEAFLRKVDPTTQLADEFVETRLHRELKTYFYRCFAKRRIGFVFGMMAIGKSTSGRQIAAEDSSWLYTSMPERGQLGDYLREVAEKRNLGTRQTKQNLRETIIAEIPDGLIVDDADECFRSRRNSWGVDTLEFIKKAYDKRPRGIVIMMDNWGRDQMLRGENSQRLLRLWRRRIPPLQLPDAPYAEDLNLFAAAAGLPPAPAGEMTVNLTDEDGEPILDEHDRQVTHRDSPLRLQNEITSRRDGGIGVWRDLLSDAQELADEQDKQITWGAVLKAHALAAAMEKRATPNDPEPDTRRKR